MLGGCERRARRRAGPPARFRAASGAVRKRLPGGGGGDAGLGHSVEVFACGERRAAGSRVGRHVAEAGAAVLAERRGGAQRDGLPRHLVQEWSGWLEGMTGRPWRVRGAASATGHHPRAGPGRAVRG